MGSFLSPEATKRFPIKDPSKFNNTLFRLEPGETLTVSKPSKSYTITVKAPNVGSEGEAAVKGPRTKTQGNGGEAEGRDDGERGIARGEGACDCQGTARP